MKNLFKMDTVSFYIKRYRSENLTHYLAGRLFAAWEIDVMNHNAGAGWRDKSDYVDIVGSFKTESDAIRFLETIGARKEFGLGGINVYVNRRKRYPFDAVYEVIPFRGRRRNMRILKGQLIYDGAVRKNVCGVYDKKDAKSRIKRGAALAAENPKFTHNIQMLRVNPL